MFTDEGTPIAQRKLIKHNYNQLVSYLQVFAVFYLIVGLPYDSMRFRFYSSSNSLQKHMHCSSHVTIRLICRSKEHRLVSPLLICLPREVIQSTSPLSLSRQCSIEDAFFLLCHSLEKGGPMRNMSVERGPNGEGPSLKGQ